MSSLFSTEPYTDGKVLLETSLGEIEIELWSKEAPKACRNFIGLVLEGYYDHNIFHRLIANFIAQTGDPSGSGGGGESFYDGEYFEDEILPRLRFTRRGLVAMANDQSPNTNQSQWFITLGECRELQGKHTIFGRVGGSTIFNAIKMNEMVTDINDRPMEPPRIKKATVITMPSMMLDIVPRFTAEDKAREKEAQALKLKQAEDAKLRKRIKKTPALLSFGDDGEAGESSTKAAKFQSSHDVLEDKKLSKKAEHDPDAMPVTMPAGRPAKPASPPPVEQKRDKVKLSTKPVDALPTADEMRSKRLADIAALEQNIDNFKRKREDSEKGSQLAQKGTDTKPQLNSKYQRRKDVKKAAPGPSQEQQLQSFEKSLSVQMKAAESSHMHPKSVGQGQIAESGREYGASDGESDGDDWINHKLVFTKEQENEQVRKAIEEFEAIDPRVKASMLKSDSARKNPSATNVMSKTAQAANGVRAGGGAGSYDNRNRRS